MGTWDSGSFDNDCAQDWVDGFLSDPRPDYIERTLEEIVEAGDAYLEEPECSAAVAAAATLAAIGSGDSADLPEDLREALADTPPQSDKKLARLALAALERIREDSELKELWEEEDATLWLASVQRLHDRLTGLL